MVITLTATLVVLLTVVVLRTETTRLHYELSDLDYRADILTLEIREKELELARLRSPARIRVRAEDLRLSGAGPSGVKTNTNMTPNPAKKP